MPKKPLVHTDPILIAKQVKRQAYYQSKREEFKKYAADRYQKLKEEFPEKVDAATMKWREDHREQYNAYHRDYRGERAQEGIPVDLKRRVACAEVSEKKRREKFEAKEAARKVEILERSRKRLEAIKLGQILPSLDELKLHVLRQKEGVECHDCLISFPSFVMEFDHRDPSQKSFNLCSFTKKDAMIFADLDAEMAKCDLVCRNCHAIRTHTLDRPRRVRKPTEASA